MASGKAGAVQTKPIALTKGKMKQPFTTKGSPRYKLLYERLIEWF
jgi:hypothetical protein